MPFEVREFAAVLHSTLPDKPDGVTLQSARGSIADPLEELSDCVSTNSVPSEKLLNDLSVGFKNLYKFASLLEDAFEKHVEEQQNIHRRVVIKVEGADSVSQEQLANMMRIATRQIQDEVAQEMERARESARAAAREAREGEARAA